MRTLAALGYKSAALFAATVSFPWLGMAVMCLALSIAVLTSNPTTYRR